MTRTGSLFAGIALLLATSVSAQKIMPADTNSLTGVIDFHCHTGPDISVRSISDVQLARLAKKDGMRGIVLKNHYTMTADRAQVAMQEVGGIEVFGGIVLNRSVGGINAEAVRRMVQIEGHRGKVVWLPTVDAENGFEHTPGPRQFVPVVKDGKPVPELAEVFQLMAKNNLVFETGHSSPQESLILIPAAKQAGVKNIVVTHAMLLGATLDQVKQMAAMGAIIEFCFQPAGLSYAKNPATIANYARVIKTVGAEHFIIDSDLGQKNNPLHPDGLRTFIAQLKANGLTEHDIDLIARKNPAKLLGLDPSN
ncbi:DUF6282 family protein [Mucilaginibacter sp.]|uniref:DUF6282 family protein n=1 Tax=Mucilaginibacter sp. TaxID=1882438 RepID=UPI00260668FB|nr:DUF6282 family protein [Mucilaginibacter sp.]